MTDPVVLMLQQTDNPRTLADFMGNRLTLDADLARSLSAAGPLVARVEIAAPEVEGEPS